MRYQVLLLNIPSNLYHLLRYRFSGMSADFTTALTSQDAMRLCMKQSFHLILLKFSRFDLCGNFLIELRRASYAPVVLFLDDYYSENARSALQSGADLCLGMGWPFELSLDYAMAQFRRYTSYNQFEDCQDTDTAAFQVGDIYIDPRRYVVRVREKSVGLRPREFRLLLYFMKNPKDILTAEQICEHAWGTEGIYGHGIAQPIRLLRQAIEPDPQHPVYIETVRLVGYRFTAKKVEYCDICDDSVI